MINIRIWQKQIWPFWFFPERMAGTEGLKPSRLSLPGFVIEYVTELVLLPRASPSLHSCAECARSQSLALVNICFVAGSRKTCILHASSCSLLRVEIQESSSSTLLCFSEIGSGTEREQRHTERQIFFTQCSQTNLHLGKITWFNLSQKII